MSSTLTTSVPPVPPAPYSVTPLPSPQNQSTLVKLCCNNKIIISIVYIAIIILLIINYRNNNIQSPEFYGNLVCIILIGLCHWFYTCRNNTNHWISALCVILCLSSTLIWVVYEIIIGPEKQEINTEEIKTENTKNVISETVFDGGNMV